MSGDLPGLPEARVLGIMAACLQQRAEHPMGSPLWVEAVSGYAACKAELDRRLLEHIVKATAERDAGEPLGLSCALAPLPRSTWFYWSCVGCCPQPAPVAGGSSRGGAVGAGRRGSA